MTGQFLREHRCALVAIGLAVAEPCADASFTKIADSSVTAPNTGTAFDPSQFALRPVVDGGAVYFVGGPDIFSNSIYRYDPVGGLDTFADLASSGISQFESFSVDGGRMAFVGNRPSTGLTTLGVWDDASLTFLADNLSPYPISSIGGVSDGRPGGHLHLVADFSVVAVAEAVPRRGNSLI